MYEVKSMDISEDDCKILCSQQYNIPPPIHLVWVCWPVMTFRQKALVVINLISLIGAGLLFTFGGPLEHLMGLV